MNVFGVYYASRSSSGFYGHALPFQNARDICSYFGVCLSGFFMGCSGNRLFDTVDARRCGCSINDGFTRNAAGIHYITPIQLAGNFDHGRGTHGAVSADCLSVIWLVPIEPVVGSVLVIAAAMPSAATTTMYAVEFDTEPDLVSSITLVTTLISIVTVTVLLNFVS